MFAERGFVLDFKLWYCTGRRTWGGDLLEVCLVQDDADWFTCRKGMDSGVGVRARRYFVYSVV